MQTKYVLVTFPEIQDYMDHPRWNECIFCNEIEGHPCPDSAYMVPEDIYNKGDKYKYKIYFVLGDPTADGHGRTSGYYLKSNYSVKEISEAYRKAIKIVGFDFVREVFTEYESSLYIPKEYTSKLLRHGLINPEFVEKEGEHEGEYICDIIEDDFIAIFKNIIRLILPDFDWVSFVDDADTLGLLCGAAYGAF